MSVAAVSILYSYNIVEVRCNKAIYTSIEGVCNSVRVNGYV